MITEELYFGYMPYSKYTAMNEANDSSTNKEQEDYDKDNNKRKINISAYFQNSFASELAAFMNKTTPVDDIANVIKDKDEQIAKKAEEVIKATQAQKKAEKEFEEMTNIASDEIQQLKQDNETLGKQYADEHAEAERLRAENKQLKQAQQNQVDSSVNTTPPQPDSQKQPEQEQQQPQDSSTETINQEEMEHSFYGIIKGTR